MLKMYIIDIKYLYLLHKFEKYPPKSRLSNFVCTF